MTREETSKYTDPLPDGTARIFSLDMDAKSLITEPAYPRPADRAGLVGDPRASRGAAAARSRASTSAPTAARPGSAATLDEPVLPKCHTRFRLPWEWNGGEATLMSRATDETGYVQPTLEVLMAARGPATAYHFNHIRAWRVPPDGAVKFAGGGA